MSKAIALPVFIFYLSFVLTITIFKRVPTQNPRYELTLFWSYRAIINGMTRLIAENFWNIILFIPIGILLSVLIFQKNAWFSIILSLILSAALEVTQLITHRGLFEFDDIIHNVLGAVIGVMLYMLSKNLREKFQDRKKEKGK